jgi:hypothetical protein
VEFSAYPRGPRPIATAGEDDHGRAGFGYGEIALGALLRRGIDRALDEGRGDEVGSEESERFIERWLSWEERRADRS